MAYDIKTDTNDYNNHQEQDITVYIQRIIDEYTKRSVPVVRGHENRAIYPSGFRFNMPLKGSALRYNNTGGPNGPAGA